MSKRDILSPLKAATTFLPFNAAWKSLKWMGFARLIPCSYDLKTWLKRYSKAFFTSFISSVGLERTPVRLSQQALTILQSIWNAEFLQKCLEFAILTHKFNAFLRIEQQALDAIFRIDAKLFFFPFLSITTTRELGCSDGTILMPNLRPLVPLRTRHSTFW